MINWLIKHLGRSSQEESEENKQRSSLMAIWVGTFCALGGFLYGYETGIINSLLSMEYVKREFASNGLFFTPLETAIITAILSVGTFLGALLAPLLSDTVGRRMTIVVITAIVFPLGTLIQIGSTGIPLLCVGRFISGIGVGIVSAVVPVYQSEASPKWIRGAVVSTYQWAITWGLLVSSAVSQGTHSLDDPRSYRIPVALQLVWTYVLAGGMYLLPESPRYYVKKDKLNSALNALSRLRKLPPTNEDLIEELVEIKAQHDYEASFGEAKLIDCFKSSPSRHSQLLRMLTGMGLQCLQQSTGINFIFYYGVNFFVKSGLKNSYIMSLITYTVNVAATVPGILLVEVVGRRKMLLVGAVGMTFCNLIIAIVGVTTDSVVANKVMMAFVCCFIAFFASSWGPIVWVICSEVYSLDVRGKAVSITASMNWLVNFAFAFSTPYLVDTGNHTASLGTKIFFIWGGCCFGGLVFSYFCVFETKGLMLEEVDEMYRCCKAASRSSRYKSKIHQRYINNELGFLPNDSDETKNMELSPTDFKNTEDSSATPTNTTLDNRHKSDETDLVARSHPLSSNDIMASLNLVSQNGFVPDLDFSRFSGTNNNDNYYHIANRSPPSLDSLSFYNGSSSSNSDDDDDDDEEGTDDAGDGHSHRYNYINEADLMNFISGLNRDAIKRDIQVREGSSTEMDLSSSTGSGTMKRDSISSSSKTVQSSSSQNGGQSSNMSYTYNNSPIDISRPLNHDQQHFNDINKPVADFTDMLSSLKLKTTSLRQNHTIQPQDDDNNSEEEHEEQYDGGHDDEEDETKS